MDWKNNLKTVGKTVASAFTEVSQVDKQQQRMDRLQSLDPDDLQVEHVMVTYELLMRLEMIDKEVVRIRNNVVFWFWVFMVGLFFGGIFLVMGVGAALIGLAG